MRVRVVIAIVIVVLLGVALWYSQRRTEPLKVSGFIEADEIRVGSRVGGRVMRVRADEGQRVKAGDVLIELEPFDLLQRKAEAAAQVRARAADLERLQNGPRPQEIAAAEARLRQAEAQHEVAETTFRRISESFKRGAASPDEMDTATEQRKTAAANVDVRKEELALLKAGTRAEEITAAKAALAAAEAMLAALEEQVAELTIKAPLDGVVEAVELEPGDLVAANAPVLSIMDTAHLWVRAYVPENRLSLSPGQQVAVTTDSLPDRRFTGRIGFIAREAEFTPNNVQTPEERSKQVFRIKVDLTEGLDVLRAGMSADVWLGGETRRG